MDTTPVYGIFEGGGAKGIAHVAAVAAAEKNKLEFIGVAGASAGALIASLVAVGYRAKELFNPAKPAENLLSNNFIDPLSLLGVREWTRFQKAMGQQERAFKAGVWGGAALAYFRARTACDVIRQINMDGGYFDTEQIRDKLNYFIRTKLVQHHAEAARTTQVPERVRFQDINPSVAKECCSLKVIVTDVTNKKPIIFDSADDYYEDVEVAEVVAASISIPFFFKPAKIPSFKSQPDATYVDGGLVSNMPIWVFVEEKLNFERAHSEGPPVTILGFTLTDSQTQGQTLTTGTSFRYLSRVINTAIFGGASNSRSVCS
jgi:NTE family protein